MQHFDISTPNSDTISLLKECVFCSDEIEIIVNQSDWRKREFGKHAQDVWPEVSPSIRDIIIVSMCPSCSERIYDVLEEDDDI